MSGRKRRLRWRSVYAVSCLLLFSSALAPLALAFAPERHDCGCVGPCVCGHASPDSSCARETRDTQETHEQSPDASGIRSCSSDESDPFVSAAYESPVELHFLPPGRRALSSGEDFESPGEVDVLPETPPPRFSS
jgi:hypothetical protein